MLFQGGFDYKRAIVDTIITIIEENTDAKEAGTFTIIFPSLSLIGTLRSEDGDVSENVAEKANSRSFNLHCDYSKSLTFSNVGEPS